MNKYLNTLPYSNYPFIWADYVELQTLACENKVFTHNDFTSLLLQNQECACAHPPITQDDANTLWQQLIEHCYQRMSLYAGHYPFIVEQDRSSIKLNFVLTHPKQRLYLGTVLAANMRHLSPEWRDRITQDFAETCHQLFINLMPVGTKIQFLMPSPDQFPPHEQIQYMARMTRGKALCNPQDFSTHEIPLSSGTPASASKAGIVDMMAWHPMGDERDGIPVAIGRCDCASEHWYSNQQTLLNLNTQLYTRHPWANYHFSPIDLYTAEKGWALNNQIGRVILLDRYRILTLAEEYFIYNDVPDLEHIDYLHQRLHDQA
ncbi:hypothetical protein [Saezia sanguinis]|uniref:hypothetical protein n=1 Tax=Saezia sanguinis TaxID=1965230 RepID=UPI003045DAB0